MWQCPPDCLARNKWKQPPDRRFGGCGDLRRDWKSILRPRQTKITKVRLLPGFPQRDCATVFLGLLARANRLRVPVEHEEQRIAKKRASREQTGDQRIFLVAAQRRVVEFQSPASGAFHKRSSGGNIPFVLGD